MTEKQRERAHLIAAAPDMREALEEIKNMKPEKITDEFKQGPLLLFERCQRVARAALAKGES